MLLGGRIQHREHEVWVAEVRDRLKAGTDRHWLKVKEEEQLRLAYQGHHETAYLQLTQKRPLD